ncbi:kinase-like domain-containing protein [Annulohypoxylon nitens]|nr:kinase-like domain-containing protein [Annulohypoxylon nitens]
MDTIPYLEDDRFCESPTSPLRPKRFNAESQWGDEIQDSNDTCDDRGDSTHLKISLDNSPSNSDKYSVPRTDEWLAAVSAGINSWDIHGQFSDIPVVNVQDKTLENQLREAILKYPRNDGQKFIPIGDFDKIVTRESVQREVELWLPEDRDIEIWVRAIWDTFSYNDNTTASPIALTSRRRIFAILVLLNAQRKIASFIREELFDKDLPFIQNKKDEWVSYIQTGQERSCPVSSLSQLDKRDADSFDNYQWFMLSPIFDMAGGRVIHYELHCRITLPVLEHELGHNPTLIGGQGEVSRIKMHGSHYVLQTAMKDPPEYFAIKKLTSPDKNQFISEVESLKRFSNDDHPHLIKLLATYYHEEKFHLIFPWADGNLRDLWKRYPKPIKSYLILLWIANQCSGIADGLRMIHRNEFKSTQNLLPPDEKKLGRHGDMKPENILWFKGSTDGERLENGVLKISDFGLTRWHRNASNNNTEKNKLGISRSYRAPEFDLDEKVSQSWDIWSLACLYLEFITWYLCGWDEGVDEFSKERAKENANSTREADYPIREDDFFNVVTKSGSKLNSNTKCEASLKRSVVSWINKLHATEGCSQFIHDFLDLISDRMLRIRSEKRTECEDIARILDDLCNKCLDEDYCSKNGEGTRRKRRNDSDPPDILDTAVIELSEETTKRLSQRINLESGTRASNEHHHPEVGAESIQPVNLSFHGQSDQPCPTLDDSNQQFESGSLTPHAHPTNDEENADAISHGLLAIEQNQSFSGIPLQSGTLSPPTGYRTGCTSSEQDRASSQNSKSNDQADTGNTEEKRHKSIWRQLREWVGLITCLRPRRNHG